MTPRELQKAIDQIDIYKMSDKDLEEFFGILLVEETKVRSVIKMRIYAKTHFIPSQESED